MESHDDSNVKMKSNNSDDINTNIYPTDPLENLKIIDDVTKFNDIKGNISLRNSYNIVNEDSYKTEGRLIEGRKPKAIWFFSILNQLYNMKES